MKRDPSKPHVFWSPRKKMWIVQVFQCSLWWWAPSFTPVRAAKRALNQHWLDTSDQEPRKTFGAK